MLKTLKVLGTPPMQYADHTSISRPIPEGSRILLLLPPFYTPYTPPLGISVVKSYIEQQGFRVKCFDFNTVPHIWVSHHKYFEVLQHARGLTPQHGYTNLWYILQAHMMAQLNGLDAQGCLKLLTQVLPIYDLEPAPEILNALLPIVEGLFADLEQTLLSECDIASFAVVGTSTYSTSLGPSLHILKRVKELAPETVTLMGGGVFADDLASGSDNLETLLREYDFVDHIVMGEGEVLFNELLRGRLRHKRVLARTDLQVPLLDMKDVMIPDYTDFHMPNYLHLCIEGARSCPFQCKFCSETVQWGDYRKKPAGVLAEQMIRLVEDYGNKTFFMGDSLMNPYIEELSKSLLERNADVLYDGYLRADRIATDRVRTKRWAKSGCVRTRLGIESASAKVLTAMKKETTPEGISKAIKTLASAGIRVTTLWIVGFPGETEEDFQETLDFIREHHRFIYELDVHYYYYYPYGQVWSRLHKCYPLYPPGVIEYVKFQQWEIEDCDPPRDVKFDRLRRINDLATEVGIPNLHTLGARYRAEERWQLLYPLAAEFFEGTLLSRDPYHPADIRLPQPAWAAPPAASQPGAHSYLVRLSKQIDIGILRQVAHALIAYNEVLQLNVSDHTFATSALTPNPEDELVTEIEFSAHEDPAAWASVAAQLSRALQPRAGHSIRMAVGNGDGSAAIVVAVDRAVADAHSVTLLLEDLFRGYEQLANDKPLALRRAENSYLEFLQKLAATDVHHAPRSSFEPGQSAEPRRSTSVAVVTDLVRRFTPKLKQQSGLSFVEFVLGGLALSLAETDARRLASLDVRANMRLVHPELQYTAGPLSTTCHLSIEQRDGDSAAEVALRVKSRLRESLTRHVGGQEMMLLFNLECLTDEPWMGGDEWSPQGFIPAAESAGNAPVELTASLDRGRVSFRIDFAEKESAFVENWCAALQQEGDNVWERLLADIITGGAQARDRAAARPAQRPRFLPSPRQHVNTSELVEFGALNGSGKPFPLVARSRVPEFDPISWATANRERIDQLMLEHGALLFRGFALNSPEQFRQFAIALSDELLEFSERAAPRIEVAQRVYTSTEYPAEYPIPLHHENAFAYKWPMKVFFYCQLPAQSGGETPIADDQRFFELLDPEVRERFRAKQIMYVRNYGIGVDLPWQEVFQTNDRTIVEAYCHSAGMRCEWLGPDRLHTTRISPAIIPHLRTGKDVWFNHAHLFHISNLEGRLRELFSREFCPEDFPRIINYGDGTPIENSVLSHIRETYTKVAVRFAWQPHDVLLLDNMAVAHGREPFVGERKTLIIMADSSQNFSAR